MPQSYHEESNSSRTYVFFPTNPSTGKPTGIAYYPESKHDLNLAEFGMYMYLATHGTRKLEDIYHDFDEPRNVLDFVLENCVKNGWVGIEEVSNAN